jgi:hypothetical protein
VLVAWQGVAIARKIPGPGNLLGHLGLWGMEQRAMDLIAPVVVVALAVVGLRLLERTSLDALARRSGLVAQLRFAVTMQDLRTVVLLRRQLSQENTRSRPWVRLSRRGRAGVSWRRGWHSLLRFPLSRIARMVVLSAGAGAAAMVAYEGTTVLFLVSGLLLFLLGMDVLEPLSQEIDQPDRLASFPRERGSVLLGHTFAPALAIVPFAGVAVVAAVIVQAGKAVAGTAAVLALPAVWLGTAGAAVSIVRDAPDLAGAAAEQTMMPPEVSGLTTVVKTLVPLIVSCAGSAGVLLVRVAHEHGQSTTPVAIRVALGQIIITALVGLWVRKRDVWRAKFRGLMEEGREERNKQLRARSS